MENRCTDEHQTIRQRFVKYENTAKKFWYFELQTKFTTYPNTQTCNTEQNRGNLGCVRILFFMIGPSNGILVDSVTFGRATNELF